MKIFLLGATGNSGSRILKLALNRGHEVTALVRDPGKLMTFIGGNKPQNLAVLTGDILTGSTDLVAAMRGHDVVINAAGYVTQGSLFTQLVQKVIDAASEALGEGGRIWQFGGAAVLDVPGANLKAVDLPMVPKVYEAHRSNLIALQKSALDWSMVCPGPMIEAPGGKPTEGLRVSADEWPVAPPRQAAMFPKLAWALAFKQAVPEMTISYEDAAQVILDNLDKSGPFSRRRVGLALPSGQRHHKGDLVS